MVVKVYFNIADDPDGVAEVDIDGEIFNCDKVTLNGTWETKYDPSAVWPKPKFWIESSSVSFVLRSLEPIRSFQLVSHLGKTPEENSTRN